MNIVHVCYVYSIKIGASQVASLTGALHPLLPRTQPRPAARSAPPLPLSPTTQPRPAALSALPPLPPKINLAQPHCLLFLLLFPEQNLARPGAGQSRLWYSQGLCLERFVRCKRSFTLPPTDTTQYRLAWPGPAAPVFGKIRAMQKKSHGASSTNITSPRLAWASCVEHNLASPGLAQAKFVRCRGSIKRAPSFSTRHNLVWPGPGKIRAMQRRAASSLRHNLARPGSIEPVFGKIRAMQKKFEENQGQPNNGF